MRCRIAADHATNPRSRPDRSAGHCRSRPRAFEWGMNKECPRRVSPSGPLFYSAQGPAMPSPTALVALFVLAMPQAQADLRAERDAIRDRETKALDAIANGLKGDEAESVRKLREAPPAPDGSTRFVPLGEMISAVRRKEPDDVRKVRLDAAKAYFELAEKALKATPPRLALADECLRRVVARDPDQAEAHRLLGYVPHDGGWATPFAVKKLTNGDVLHPKYGWVEKDWVPAPRPRRAARAPGRPAADAMAARGRGRRAAPGVQAGLADRHRALRDPDERPARRGDRLRPPPRGVRRAVHLADGRRHRPRRPAAGRSSRRTPGSRPTSCPRRSRTG